MNLGQRMLVVCLVGLLLGIASHLLAASEVDHRLWSELLASHVQAGRVDYQGMKKDEVDLDRYLDLLAQVQPGDLARNEQLAFYINAYNAWTVKLILSHFSNGRPVDSIKDIGGVFSSPWKLKICRINGDLVSLDHLEHGIIRPTFKEPRVHFAVNCASKSCPPLLATAYTGVKLEQQLEEQAVAFINDTRFNNLQKDVLHVSRIFSWFAEDFGADIKGYVARYARGELQRQLRQKGSSVEIEYLDYDWSLNSR